MRFYLDENLSDQIAIVGRGRGLDIISSHESGRNGLLDSQQLQLAGQEGRCLVTRDIDFVKLTHEFYEKQRPHAGVLIVPRSFADQDVSSIVEALLLYAQHYEGDLPSYTIAYLSLPGGG